MTRTSEIAASASMRFNGNAPASGPSVATWRPWCKYSPTSRRSVSTAAGEGFVIGGDAVSYGSPCLFEVPVTHRMMRHVTDSMPANADASLKLKWSGILRVKWDPAPGDLANARRPRPR